MFKQNKPYQELARKRQMRGGGSVKGPHKSSVEVRGVLKYHVSLCCEKNTQKVAHKVKDLCLHLLLKNTLYFGKNKT